MNDVSEHTSRTMLELPFPPVVWKGFIRGGGNVGGGMQGEDEMLLVAISMPTSSGKK